MKTFLQYIQEALDKPYNYKKANTIDGDEGSATHHYGFKDHNGSLTHIYITHGKKSSQASVDFTDENGDFEATGKGSIRHLSTVKKVMQDHAEKHPHLKAYEFTGEKDRDKKDGGGRARLYKRLTKVAGGHTSEDQTLYTKHWIPINRDKNGD